MVMKSQASLAAQPGFTLPQKKHPQKKHLQKARSKKLITSSKLAVCKPAPLKTVSELWHQQPLYDRSALGTGIVHFGPGRFFRGHLARIIHQYLAHNFAQNSLEDSRWGICGVSLNSRDTLTALQPQDYLYTVVKRYCSTEHCTSPSKPAEESAEVIGSISQIVDGKREHDRVLNLMSSADVHLVTLTVTQAGYCLDSQFNLDVSHPAIAHDLQHPTAPTTVIGFIVQALKRRREQGMAPFTTLSCDNLPRNGDILQRAVLSYAEQLDPEFAAYLQAYATFPNTVVDQIVPKAQDSDVNYPRKLLQISDRAPIVTEPFWQFVVEDSFTQQRPAWENVGVIMTDDITPYLHLKSRLLNAMHSFVACLAARAGIEYVHEAMGVSEMYGFIQHLIDDVSAATPIPAEMCEQYRRSTLLRFSNEALPDTIERISAETARKLGKYIVPIVRDAYNQNISLKRLMLPIAAWILALKEGAESSASYQIYDHPSVVLRVQSGAPLSQIIGLEPSDCTATLDQDCEQALQEIQKYGLLASLRRYCKEQCEKHCEEPNEIVSAG
jgi:mannitol-1-phosphate/altronate dehydrogenase